MENTNSLAEVISSESLDWIHLSVGFLSVASGVNRILQGQDELRLTVEIRLGAL